MVMPPFTWIEIVLVFLFFLFGLCRYSPWNLSSLCSITCNFLYVKQNQIYWHHLSFSGGGGNFILSTSCIGYTTVCGGVAPMCPHGYGVFYCIQEDRLYFCFIWWFPSCKNASIVLLKWHVFSWCMARSVKKTDLHSRCMNRFVRRKKILINWSSCNLWSPLLVLCSCIHIISSM